MAKKNGNGKRSNGSNTALKTTAAALAGGAVGAIGGALAARAGIAPQTAATGVTVAGGVGAFTLSGAGRWAAAGMAAAGAGQLALGWLAKKTIEAQQQAEKQAAIGNGQPRQGLPGDVSRAFADARAQMEEEEEFN